MTDKTFEKVLKEWAEDRGLSLEKAEELVEKGEYCLGDFEEGEEGEKWLKECLDEDAPWIED